MELPDLLGDAWRDFQGPNILWQLAAITGAVVLGWLLSRAILGRLADAEPAGEPKLGPPKFSRVLTPTLIFFLLLGAKPLLGNWHHISLLRMAIPLIGSLALIRFVFYVLQRAFDGRGKSGATLLMLEKTFAIFVWAGVALYISGWWTPLIGYLETTVVPLGRNKVALLTILQAAVSVVATLLIAMWGGAALEEKLMRVDTMHSSLRAVMARMGKAVLIVAAVLVSLSLVGIDLTVLSVFGGALGVGLGLGLQKITSNYISGFIILLERSLSIGDMIGVDALYGKVTHINTRYTVLRALDGVESIVPNEMFVSGLVQNYSLTDRSLRLSTSTSVGYETDIETLLPQLAEVTAAVNRVSKENPPVALFTRFGADGLELEVGFWINDPENGRLSVLSDVNRAIWKLLQEKKIRVPYPQREIKVTYERGDNVVPFAAEANAQPATGTR
jgi:small-conductance mechanosensitive channel